LSPNIATLVTSLDSAQNAMTLAYQGSQLAAQQAAVADKAHADAYNVYLNARDAMQKALKAVQDGIAGDYPVPAVQTPSSSAPPTAPATVAAQDNARTIAVKLSEVPQAPVVASPKPTPVAQPAPVVAPQAVPSAAPPAVTSVAATPHTQAVDAVLASPSPAK
jgi:hypothetical protein